MSENIFFIKSQTQKKLVNLINGYKVYTKFSSYRWAKFYFSQLITWLKHFLYCIDQIMLKHCDTPLYNTA